MTIPPAKTRDWMESLADLMIQQPQLTQKEIAQYFNYSAIWIGVVINSDAFKELMAIRREVHSSLVSSSVIQKVEALAHQSVEEMSRQIQEKEVPLDKVREVADLALRSLGFTQPRGTITPSGIQQTNVQIVIDQEALASARAKMLEKSAKEIIVDQKALTSSGPTE